PQGTQGYDGQFVYYIARDPDPETVKPFLDVPAYRYQRILLPLLARFVALGQDLAIPWSLAALGILFQTAGTWALATLLDGWGVNRWYALAYGMFAGLTLAVRLDLPEPLAYGLVVGGFLAIQRQRNLLSWLCFGLALFAKEVTVIFLGAALLSALLNRRWNDLAGLSIVALVPYGLFQFWLWQVFGQSGIGSGGAMATSFEVIPFMGLLRIGFYSPLYLVAMLAVFGPAIVLPTLWGLWVGFKKLLSGDMSLVVLALILNAPVMLFLPFSTYRETGGSLRIACGLILAILIFSSRYRLRKVLNYSLLWLVLNAFLLKS
ncbi:MAG TPA: hypothetical protein VFO38_02490, partial [Candidatus Saccharimonadales bacterium]|nr:hypothetical protein [Candidatus Saccharimonadales bacterium]